MTIIPKAAAAALGLALVSSGATAAETAAMSPTRTIAENAARSNDHTTLVQALQAAGLVDTLKGPGPFTVFAPTNAAMARLPAATLEDKSRLTQILGYHVVPGRITAQDLAARIKAGGGKAVLTTVQGERLTASMMGSMVMLTGAKGGMSHITQADLTQSNGLIHVVDGVVLP